MTEIDVFGMCNAIYDLQADVEYEMLEELGLVPGAVHLIDEHQHAALLTQIAPRVVHEAAGGSGANTMVGVAALGGLASFTSKVGPDPHGEGYIASLAKAGVQPLLRTGSGRTGSCIVLVTPDGQRTMCTYVGEGRHYGPEDVPLPWIARSRTVYVTGYLWDTPCQKQAVKLAVEEACAHRVPVALSLADRFCIERNQAEFANLLDTRVKIVFANEDEATLMCDAQDALAAARSLGSEGRTAFVTLGANGALVASKGVVEHVPTDAVTPRDTTGAGDAFAAGVLYGLSRGMAPLTAAQIGCRLAAHVVSRIGPRPDPDVARQIST